MNKSHFIFVVLVVGSFAIEASAVVFPRVLSVGLPYFRKTKTSTEMRDFGPNTGLDGEAAVEIDDLTVEDPNPPYSPSFKSGLNRASIITFELPPKTTAEVEPKYTS